VFGFIAIPLKIGAVQLVRLFNHIVRWINSLFSMTPKQNYDGSYGHTRGLNLSARSNADVEAVLSLFKVRLVRFFPLIEVLLARLLSIFIGIQLTFVPSLSQIIAALCVFSTSTKHPAFR